MAAPIPTGRWRLPTSRRAFACWWPRWKTSMGAHLAKPARSAGRRKGDVAADEAVYGAIRRAMHMGRLSPGTKLQEPALARVLKVSRERVRKALHRLVHEGWLQAVPNRRTLVPADGRGDAADLPRAHDAGGRHRAAAERRTRAERRSPAQGARQQGAAGRPER